MVSRRTLLGSVIGSAALGQPAAGRVSREVFLASPKAGTAVMASAFYTAARGGGMMSVETRYSRSDTVDAAFYRYSTDHGRTWGAPVERKTAERQAMGGMLRRHPRTGVVEPTTGKFIEFSVEGVLPTDDPLEGMRHWNVFYRVDGVTRQAIHAGSEFSAAHSFPGVYSGRSMVMLGDVASVPLVMRDGTILLPAITTPLGADGKPYNPTGGYTYTDAVVLHGRWRKGGLEWKSSAPVKGDPARSTRGMDEPTLARLAGGRLMMVMRGSNDRNPALPAHKWISWSEDGGMRWSAPVPWTFEEIAEQRTPSGRPGGAISSGVWRRGPRACSAYASGEAFYSPSACSQLVPHSSGKLYWIGHIAAENARGNRPRYPVYLGEVDTRSGLLKRESLVRVDDRAAGEDEILMLYSICAREDRGDGRIALQMSRLFAYPDAWRGDAMLYRIAV